MYLHCLPLFLANEISHLTQSEKGLVANAYLYGTVIELLKWYSRYRIFKFIVHSNPGIPKKWLLAGQGKKNQFTSYANKRHPFTKHSSVSGIFILPVFFDCSMVRVICLHSRICLYHLLGNQTRLFY